MASGKNAETGFQTDSDVHISYEDQQKINKFARQNAKLEDYKEELKAKQEDIRNLEYAHEELMLADSDSKIPYRIGEVFIEQDYEKTQISLDDAKMKKKKEIEDLEAKCADLKVVMAELKAQLYAKFGNHINLEAEED